MKEVMEAVKVVETKKMKVAVKGVLQRPREDNHYEEVRRQTNTKIQEKLIKKKIEWMKEKKGNVSFINKYSLLGNDVFFDRRNPPQ